MTGKEVVAGLDVGTSSMVAVVARVGDSERAAGVGCCPSLGMRKGIVIDVEGVAQSVRRAVEMAQEAAGVRISTICVGFSGHGVNVLTKYADISIGQGGRITTGDVADLMEILRLVEVPAGRRVLQVVPVEFAVDGVPMKDNPVGCRGSKLSLKARVVTVDSQLVDQLVAGVELTGLRVEEVVVNPLLVAQGVLNTVERELGAALVDLGGGTTAVTVFKSGTLVDMAVIPVGGEHITSDLAIGVRTSLEAAEKVKREVGLLPQEAVYVELPSMGGLSSRRASLSTIKQIIESRVLEILDLVKQTIDRLARGEVLPGGILLTGGGSCLKGMAELASRVLQLPVRVATEEPDLQAACFLARHAASRVGRQENRRLAVAAGEFRFGPGGVREIFTHLRRGYPHGSGTDG